MMTYRRIEVRIADGDDLLTELASEAAQRGVTLPIGSAAPNDAYRGLSS